MSRIQLGDKVKDTVTGFTGIAIGRTTWLHGCDRVVVQPPVKKDGTLGENQQFDEPSLVIVSKQKVKEGDHATGGFNIMPAQRRA